MSSYEEKIQAAVVHEEGKQDGQEVPTLKLSTGVVLKLKKFSFMRVQSILSKFKDPEIPLVYDKERGRDLRNPDDPTYLAKKAEVETERMMAVVDAIAVFGTDIESVPNGFPLPSDDSWIDELEFVNVVTVDRTSELARKLNWIKYVAVRDPEDLVKIANEFGVQMGTAEKEVVDQLHENFPR